MKITGLTVSVAQFTVVAQDTSVDVGKQLTLGDAEGGFVFVFVVAPVTSGFVTDTPDPFGTGWPELLKVTVPAEFTKFT